MADMIHPLGRHPSKPDHRTFQFSKYVSAALETGALPPPPASFGWNTTGINWGMMGNNIYGDCCIAGMGHTLLMMTQLASPPGIRPSDAQVLDAYCRACGYNRGPGPGNGCSMLGVLSYWRNYGLAVGADPVAYGGTLLSGSFQANESLVCQTVDPRTASIVVLNSKGQPMNPSQIPAWSFANISGTVHNVVAGDKKSVVASGTDGSSEILIANDGSLSAQATIRFAKDTGFCVSQSGNSMQVTGEIYPFQPNDVIVGVTSGAQFKVAPDNQSPFPVYHKILAYTALASSFTNPMFAQEPTQAVKDKAMLEVKLAIQMFGVAFIAMLLPTSAQSGWSSKVWDVPSTGRVVAPGVPGSWGGHCVCFIGYDAEGLFFVTWGMVCKMTWAFFHGYVDESYAILSTDWINKATALSASGFDFVTLRADLAAITAG